MFDCPSDATPLALRNASRLRKRAQNRTRALVRLPRTSQPQFQRLHSCHKVWMVIRQRSRTLTWWASPSRRCSTARARSASTRRPTSRACWNSPSPSSRRTSSSTTLLPSEYTYTSSASSCQPGIVYTRSPYTYVYSKWDFSIRR